MTEIAKDFQSSVASVETDLAELIRAGKIPYKIDQFTQLQQLFEKWSRLLKV